VPAVQEDRSGRAASSSNRSLIWLHAVLVGIVIALLLADWGRIELLTFHEQSFAIREFSRLTLTVRQTCPAGIRVCFGKL
jgi:hypothetical protein